MIVQVVQESPQEKIRIGGTKDCNNEFILLSAISLLVYVSKKENLGVDELLDNCHIKELKTGKMQHYRMDKRLHKDVLDYIERNHLADHDYLFKGQKKKQSGISYVLPLTREMGYKIMKQNADEVGVVSTFGMHSLRKTFGYFYIKNGGNVITLMKMYNHDEPATTLRYVCWENDDAEKERSRVYIAATK